MSDLPQQPPRSIEEIFAPIGGQKNSCTLAEYLAFARLVRELAPARLLVFGVGRDSAAWIECNRGGTTRFLENNPEWIDRIGAEVDPHSIVPVEYPLSFAAWESNHFSQDATLFPKLQAELVGMDREWDAAFVDAPWGPTYGRHQSTWVARHAVRPGGLVALHDCDREQEQLIAQILLEDTGFALLKTVERLRIYRAPS